MKTRLFHSQISSSTSIHKLLLIVLFLSQISFSSSHISNASPSRTLNSNDFSHIICNPFGFCQRNDGVDLRVGAIYKTFKLNPGQVIDFEPQIIDSFDPFKNTKNPTYIKGSDKYVCADGFNECYNACCKEGFCTDGSHFCSRRAREVKKFVAATVTIFIALVIIYWCVFVIIGVHYQKKRTQVLSKNPNKEYQIEEGAKDLMQGNDLNMGEMFYSTGRDPNQAFTNSQVARDVRVSEVQEVHVLDNFNDPFNNEGGYGNESIEQHQNAAKAQQPNDLKNLPITNYSTQRGGLENHLLNSKILYKSTNTNEFEGFNSNTNNNLHNLINELNQIGPDNKGNSLGMKDANQEGYNHGPEHEFNNMASPIKAIQDQEYKNDNNRSVNMNAEQQEDNFMDIDLAKGAVNVPLDNNKFNHHSAESAELNQPGDLPSNSSLNKLSFKKVKNRYEEDVASENKNIGGEKELRDISQRVNTVGSHKSFQEDKKRDQEKGTEPNEDKEKKNSLNRNSLSYHCQNPDGVNTEKEEKEKEERDPELVQGEVNTIVIQKTYNPDEAKDDEDVAFKLFRKKDVPTDKATNQ